MGETDFQDTWDRHFVLSVRRAAARTFELAACRPPEHVYGVLAEELRRRGIDPDSEAVYDGSVLISQGKKPAVLQGLD